MLRGLSIKIQVKPFLNLSLHCKELKKFIRYDARLLLDTLPSLQNTTNFQSRPGSPGGWSDLPSDNEDMFFLSPEEVEDLRRDKKRRHIEHLREERLKALRADEGESSDEEEVWGGSDEEAHLVLTLCHLLP